MKNEDRIVELLAELLKKTDRYDEMLSNQIDNQKGQASVQKQQAQLQKEQALVQKEQGRIQKIQAAVQKEQAKVQKEQALILKDHTGILNKHTDLLIDLSEGQRLLVSEFKKFREMFFSMNIEKRLSRLEAKVFGDVN